VTPLASIQRQTAASISATFSINAFAGSIQTAPSPRSPEPAHRGSVETADQLHSTTQFPGRHSCAPDASVYFIDQDNNRISPYLVRRHNLNLRGHRRLWQFDRWPARLADQFSSFERLIQSSPARCHWDPTVLSMLCLTYFRAEDECVVSAPTALLPASRETDRSARKRWWAGIASANASRCHRSRARRKYLHSRGFHFRLR